jgi:hypothetical protein
MHYLVTLLRTCRAVWCAVPVLIYTLHALLMFLLFWYKYRLVKWSDGSMQLLVGDEAFDIQQNDMKNSFAFVRSVSASLTYTLTYTPIIFEQHILLTYTWSTAKWYQKVICIRQIGKHIINIHSNIHCKKLTLLRIGATLSVVHRWATACVQCITAVGVVAWISLVQSHHALDALADVLLCLFVMYHSYALVRLFCFSQCMHWLMPRRAVNTV